MPRYLTFSTRRQISSGSVTFRRTATGIQFLLIQVGTPKIRWQLPKGLVETYESPEITAIRETQEEGGVYAELVAPLDTIEYWYVGTEKGERVRYHKFVHFFLLEYQSGDVQDHDDEVDEARWVPMDHAVELLTFPSEQRIVKIAKMLLRER